MSNGFKDSPEVVEFRVLFARLKDWSENDPDSLSSDANADKEIEKLGLHLLKAAGRIQKRERIHRDLFTGPVDPKFISEWRDFEERFAITLLNIRTVAAAGDRDLLFSFDFYEEPDQWAMADYKAMSAARSLDKTIRYARVHAEQVIEAVGPELILREINIKVQGPNLQVHFDKMVDAELKVDDELNKFAEEIRGEIASSNDETQKSKLRSMHFAFACQLDDEHDINYTAKEGWEFWENLKYESRLDLRGIIRRRALIPFVLFPRHVSARLTRTDLPSIYQNLRQAHEAFVFGVHFAALTLMRSVMEIVVRDHYGGTGSNLSQCIDSATKRRSLPKARADKLYELKNLADKILHVQSEGGAGITIKDKRDFELQIITHLFTLRALIEESPLLRCR